MQQILHLCSLHTTHREPPFIKLWKTAWLKHSKHGFNSKRNITGNRGSSILRERERERERERDFTQLLLFSKKDSAHQIPQWRNKTNINRNTVFVVVFKKMCPPMPIRIGYTFLDVGQISRCKVCIWFKVAQNWCEKNLISCVFLSDE